MNIVFFCQSCGARFEVGEQMAGKKGHCKKCGQMMEIPRAERLASMTAMPALGVGEQAPAAVSARPRAQARVSGEPPNIGGWLRSAATGVGLEALTIDRMPLGMKKRLPASPLDDAEDSKLYELAGPDPYAGRSQGAGPAGAAVQAWRKEVGGLQRFIRWLGETAYLISLPFLAILLFGIATKNRNLSLFGATFVVLLNIGRIVAAVANLATVPLRDGIRTKKMKKPLRRLVEPVLMIVGVFLAFTFIPWLSSEQASEGSIKERLKASAVGLKGEMRGELEKSAAQAKAVDLGADLQKVGTRVKGALKTVGTGPGGAPVVAPGAGPK